MTRDRSDGKKPRLRGVNELPTSHGERRFRARISRGKGRQVNLGLYPDRWLAAFAYNVAAEALYGQDRPRNEIPETEQPDADRVRRITASVRLRLGLDAPGPPPSDRPPDADRLFVLFEITVVGFWRDQVSAHGARTSRELEVAARRLVEAAHLLFWCHASGHPRPMEVMTRLLAQRLNQAFRRADLTREVLDDEGDDELGLARWLVLPDEQPGGGFRATIAHQYADFLGPTATDFASADATPAWSVVLGIAPPFSSRQIRAAYRARSKEAHPDAGGDHAGFIRLKTAYEQARSYCAALGL